MSNGTLLWRGGPASAGAQVEGMGSWWVGITAENQERSGAELCRHCRRGRSHEREPRGEGASRTADQSEEGMMGPRREPREIVRSTTARWVGPSWPILMDLAVLSSRSAASASFPGPPPTTRARRRGSHPPPTLFAPTLVAAPRRRRPRFFLSWESWGLLSFRDHRARPEPRPDVDRLDHERYTRSVRCWASSGDERNWGEKTSGVHGHFDRSSTLYLAAPRRGSFLISARGAIDGEWSAGCDASCGSYLARCATLRVSRYRISIIGATADNSVTVHREIRCLELGIEVYCGASRTRGLTYSRKSGVDADWCLKC